MRRKVVIAILIGLVCGISLGFGTKFLIDYKKELEEKKREEEIKNATIIVDLVEDLDIPFTKDVKVSDFITNINGTIVKDKVVDTSELGNKVVRFEYINDENIKIPYEFNINVVDVTPPLVWLGSSYSVPTTFDSTLEEKIMCADDHDDEPNCYVEGEYDTKVVGSYNLVFKAEDSSGNVTEQPFTLRVYKSSSSSSSNGSSSRLDFNNAKEILGVENAKFGIDVSSWQGDIDFDKVKEAGVEFAFVRVGSTKGMGGEFFIDSKFERNMEGFNNVGIPVGAYFYSYAQTEEEARGEALWVIEHLKKYKVDLPVAFDFEDWGRYNRYKMSLYRLNRNAEVFIETLKEAGYDGMLYGSLNYMNKVWDYEDKTVWVAHYTTSANYKDRFAYWQFSSSGRINGINGAVDLDIMY